MEISIPNILSPRPPEGGVPNFFNFSLHFWMIQDIYKNGKKRYGIAQTPPHPRMEISIHFFSFFIEGFPYELPCIFNFSV